MSFAEPTAARRGTAVALHAPVASARRPNEGALQLILRRGAQRTVLQECYFQVPLQVMRPLYLDDVGTAYVYLVSPCGGVVGGDTYDISVVVEAGARVCLTTPSASKIYATTGAPATQRLDLTVQAGAVLEYLPEQTIPYAQSAFRQSIHVRLGAGACVLLSEIVAPGRLARGEAFAYHEYDARLCITDGRDQVLVRDRLWLRPGRQPLGGLGCFEGYHYLGTLYVLQEGVPVPPALIEQVQTHLGEYPGLLAGATQLAHGGLAVRVLGQAHTPVRQALHEIWDLLRRELLGYPAVVWRT